MAQALYIYNYRTFYINSQMKEVEPSDLRRALKVGNCSVPWSFDNTPIYWVPGRPDRCSLPVPAGSDVLNIRYFVWVDGKWVALPFAYGREYSGPADPSLADLRNPRNYRGQANEWAMRHGQIRHNARV